MILRPYIKALVMMVVLAGLVSTGFAQDHGEKAVAVAQGSFNKAFAVGIACFGVALGVGLVGFAAASGVSRNPGASGQILMIAIISMAMVEAIAFYVIFFPF